MRRQFLAAMSGAFMLLLAVSAANVQAYEYQEAFKDPYAGMEDRPRAAA